MKLPVPLLPLILLTSAGLQGCGHETSPSKVDAADSQAQPPGTTLEGQAKGAMDAAKVAVAKGQDEWRKLAETQLPEIDRKITELKDKVSKASGSAKVELDKLVQEIGEQRQALQEKLGELKSSGAEKWDGVRIEVDHTLGELRKTIDQALEKSK
jgi:hypothetical protein